MNFSRLRPAAALLPLLLLISCSSGSPRNSAGSSRPTVLLASSASAASMPGVTSEAQKLNVTPGRIALGEIVCQLDSSNVLEDLVAKNTSRELLEILRETALQKSTTLETIDEKYGLTSILASEGIYVAITSNGVTEKSGNGISAPPASDWVPRFESAISSGN